ncbi:MAG: uroporphyrinogen-III C-methyltransferase [Clostridiales bacterium]|nr:uroporphyrinogen-III C-methyltransferase [Clostridiales bacterium]
MTDTKTTGKVWLVGAGPSDPGLLTLRGKQVLQKADVVLCDALVGAGILAMIPPAAEKIYVGKRSGDHAMPQRDINRLLADLALAGKRVVRLKGGDPFLFGRGGEELELLNTLEIPYEVVPGVTSALAVPAYQGIPVTHRDFCSSVHIITGHRRDGSDDAIDYEALVRTGGTLIFLMGASSLGDICGGLLKGGMAPDMPAALLMRGTTPEQRRILATVGTLEAAAERQRTETPAIIVIGKVCSLAEKFSWFEALPLAGVRLLLTRPEELIHETAEKLRSLGAQVIEYPTIHIARRENNAALHEALRHLDRYQWLVFTSPTGVRIFFEEIQVQHIDVRRLSGIRIAAMGRGTQKELASRYLYADLIPEIYDGKHLGLALAQAGADGERVLIPRAAAGNQDLINALSRKRVDDIPAYDTILSPQDSLPRSLAAELESGKIDYVLFTSASCVRGFASAAGSIDYSDINAVCIGKQTQREADALGMKTQTSEQASIDSLIDCLIHTRKESL